jgi:UDP-N-acetylglucosamine 3-dehydrogenase
VKLALIGCGSIARRSHLPAFKKLEGVEVVALASRSLTSAEAAAEECGGGNVYDDWRKVLDLDIDAVDICSPNANHVDQAVAAAEAGKHVLVEKPMACTLDEANDMLEAAKDSAIVMHVAHNLRYVPTLVAARDNVPRVGNIVAVRAAFGHSGPRGWAPDATWFFDKELSGGGALIDLGIHAIDFVRFVTGLEATHVNAMTFGNESVEDAAQLTIRFETGAIGSVHASWVARPAPDFGLTIFGTDGTLHLDARTPLTFRAADGEKIEIELPEAVSSPYEDFVLAASGGTPRGNPATAEDGRAAVAIVSAAYEAAATGSTVEVAR